MPSTSDELTQRLLAALARLPEERVARLIDEAWSDAEDAVRGTLTTAMHAVLLRQVVAQVEGATPTQHEDALAEADHEQAPNDFFAARREDAEAHASSVVEEDVGSHDAPEPSVVAEDVGSQPAVEGCYVYGILDDPIELPSSLPGVDPDRPVHLVHANGLAALASPVLTEEFGPEGLRARLGDRAWVEEKVRRHEAVLQHGLLQAKAMVPMRFCTVLRTTGDLAEFLTVHRERLAAALGQLNGRREHGVKVLIDDERFESHLEETSAEVRRLDAQATERGSGAAYFLDKRRKQLLVEEGERVAAARVDEWHERLARLSADAATLPLRSTDEESGRGRMMHNGAYLVDDTEWDGFAEAVDAIHEEGAAVGLRVELTGPWPPYTFVDADLVGDLSQ